jgi:Flp pilus assembly protein TadG
MFFAVIAVSLLGIVSFATEVGTWYLTRSAADNAADASAVAAALAISVGASPEDAANETASNNGYASSGGGVTVIPKIPPQTGSYTANGAAAEVLINVTVTPILATLFGSTTPTVASRSVALVEQIGDACVLSTIGDMQITAKQVSVSCM